MATAQPAHDSALQHPPAPTQEASATSPPTSNTPAASTTLPPGLLPGMSNDQVIAILKTVPGVFPARDGTKDATAAEALSNLAQSGYTHQLSNQGIQMHSTFQVHTPQFASTALQNGGPPPISAIRTDVGEGSSTQPADVPSAQSASAHFETGSPNSQSESEKPTPRSGGRRSGRSATMTNDEWTRQRKDNHKEVERRRRGNINEGINELGRIVPNGSGEKAKGAILSRAVQYIHHLKENEARNIEKWTLEKLLMDQAMGDLQAQLEEMKKLWEEERHARQRLETELDNLKAQAGRTDAVKEGGKRGREDAPGATEASETEDERAKRQRTD